MYLPVNPINSL
jgi:aroFGH: 3-deoxy-7-phosphoheptulonate synthase